MKGQRFRLKSLLGQHSDHDRPRLRALIAANMQDRKRSLGTDAHSTAMRQQEIRLCASEVVGRKDVSCEAGTTEYQMAPDMLDSPSPVFLNGRSQ